MTSALDASASVRAVREGGRTVLRDIASDPPITLRRTADGLMIVNSAGGPLRGDSVRFSMTVDEGATLVCGSIAATVAQDGPGPAQPSRLDVTAGVARGGSLDWRPKPTVSATGSDHVMTFTARLNQDATLFATEVVVLGRHRESPGHVRSRWDISAGGTPVLVQDLDLGVGAPAGWDGPAVTGGATVIVMAIAVDPAWDEEARRRLSGPSPRGEVLDLAHGGVLLTALVADTVEAEIEIASFAERLGSWRGIALTRTV